MLAGLIDMARGRPVTVFSIAVLCLLGLECQVFALKCFSCQNAENNEECIARGEIKVCKEDQMCLNRILNTRDGSQYEIHKGCSKRAKSCENVENQNKGVYPYKCEYKDDQSVCKCCCSTDMCNGPQMECKDAVTCTKPSAPGNGKLRCKKQVTFGSKCMVVCNKGYKRVGPRVLTCMNGTDQGYWSPKQGVACVHKAEGQKEVKQKIACKPRMKKPAHGSMVCENAEPYKDKARYNYIGTKCAFRCESGYFLMGPDTVQCLSGAKWSGPAPKCKPGFCQPPPQDKNRIDDCSDKYNVGSSCNMKCRDGYQLVGPSDTTCESVNNKMRQGIWTNGFPSCVKAECRPFLQRPSNGKMECTNSNLYKSTCSFYCDEGFDLTGTELNTAEVRCTEDGTGFNWDGTAPRCQRINCKRLRIPENGNIACDGDQRVGTKCTFSCNIGYDIVGTPNQKWESVCENDFNGDNEGKWSVEAITCAPIKCLPRRKDPENGIVVCSNSNSLGSICIYSCDENHDLDGTTDATLINTCESGTDSDGIGRWSENPGSCSTRFACEFEHTDPEHGSVSCSDGLYKGSICTFACKEGYEMVGVDTTTCLDLKNDGDSTCEWSNKAPKCVVSTCIPQWYDTASLRVSCSQRKVDGSYPVGTKCTYSCIEPGYYLEYSDTGKGNGGVTCTKKKQWSRPTSPRCVVKTCEHLTKIENGRKPKCTAGNKYGSECTFSCDSRYVLSHSDSLICQAEKNDKKGSWDLEPPVCRLNECEKVPEHSAKGKVTCSSGAEIGSYCTLDCDVGYAAKIKRVDCVAESEEIDGEEVIAPKFLFLDDFCCARCKSDYRFVQMVDARFKSELQKMIEFTKIIVTNLAGKEENEAYFSTVMYNDEILESSMIESVPLKAGDTGISLMFETMQTWSIDEEGKKSDTRSAINYANDVMFAKLDKDAANFLILAVDDEPTKIDANFVKKLKERNINVLVVANNNLAKILWERILGTDGDVMSEDVNLLMQRVHKLAFKNGCASFANKCE